jgi:hypothetical protein
MFRGKYFVEESIFNLDLKSIKTTIVSLDHSNFHKVESSEKIAHSIKYYSDPNILAGYGYIRQFKDSSSIFKNAFVVNYRKDSSSLLKLPATLYKKFVLAHYLSWRV